MAPVNPCPHLASDESASTRSKQSFTRCQDQPNKKGSLYKCEKEEQIIAFVPDPNGKNTFYSSDKEDSKYYEPVIAFSLSNATGKKTFYITEKASFSRKCKPGTEIYIKDCKDEEIKNYAAKQTDKSLKNTYKGILHLCQKTVVAASSVELVDENKNDTNTNEDNEQEDVKDNDTCEETNQNKAENCDNNAQDNIQKITKEKESNNSVENESSSRKPNDNDKDVVDCEDCLIFPGAQEVYKRVEEISEELFKAPDSYAHFNDIPCEPQKNIYDKITTTPEEIEMEPAEKESSKTIFQTVQSISSVHVRSIEESKSLYQTMRKKVTSIFSFNDKHLEEDDKALQGLQLSYSKRSARSFMQDIFFDDGFTSN